ncbi:MAG: ABC transporter ATP-binding protein [Planctomycetes bacterium]|nr:ABC transporter ATP-binding protein [Planctomycetota bacterium]MCB9888692.1 ABC transporter ATP-binding protein [Planctomycetota bacterium]
MADAALSIEGIRKCFGRSVALDAVSFEVPRGSVFGLLGPNGAGKTTLFSIVASFLRADAGSIRVLGVDVRHISELQGRLGILPQDAVFQRNVPILDQLTFFRVLDGQPRAAAEAEARAALEKVGIGAYAKRGVHALSHGMVKRLGVAQAFLGAPEVILLDEPTSGLDPQNARQIRDLIVELQAGGRTTTVISSHNLLEIQEICDHVAILDRGRLVTCGSVKAITAGGRRLEVTFGRPLADAVRTALAALDVVHAVEQRGPLRYAITLAEVAGSGGDADDDAAVARVLQTALDHGATPRAWKEGHSLEEFFLQVTGKRSGEPVDAG